MPSASSRRASRRSRPAIEAPDATLPALAGDGEGSLADYRGQWVLVNFWASWCVPCRDESPALEGFHRRHRGDGFTVLGIDYRDVTADGVAFVEEFELTYPLLRDRDGELYDDYGADRRARVLPRRPRRASSR